MKSNASGSFEVDSNSLPDRIQQVLAVDIPCCIRSFSVR